MPTLTDGQHRAILDLVGEAHDARDLEELRAGLMAGLPRAVPADFVSYNEIHRDGMTALTIARPDVPEFAHEAWERLAGTNPLVQRFVLTRDGRPYRFSDVVDREELHRSAIYQELYGPLGIEHQMALVLPSPPSLTIAIALSRGPGRDFSDAEREMVGLIRPHLIQAYRNAQLRERSAEVIESLQAGLDRHGVAAVVLAPDDTVAFVTEPARALLGRMEIGKPAGAERTLAQDGMLVHRVRRPEGGAVLFVEQAQRVLTADALESLGLSPAEARVLAALARGLSTAEAARELDVSPRTVLKHGERIHRKLGVRDRAQAVATAWAATAAAGG